MPLIFSCIAPHPPILIPKIGQENLAAVKNTIFSLKELNRKIQKQKIDTIFIVSPHGPLNRDQFLILGDENLWGDFADFGYNDISASYKNDLDTVSEISKKMKKENIPFRIFNDNWLDHGCLVPLHYLAKNLSAKLIVSGFNFLDLKTHFKYGKALTKVFNKSKKRFAFVASGDLSHRLTKDAPAGFSPIGKKFDDKLIELLKNNKVSDIINLKESLQEEAGECGLRSIAILLGAMSDKKYSTKIQSYEGPFGVGYLVADFII